MIVSGVAPTMSNPMNQHIPVPFTATCPACGQDAAWTTTYSKVGRKPDRGVFGPVSHIDCPHCGPCPCGAHTTDS